MHNRSTILLFGVLLALITSVDTAPAAPKRWPGFQFIIWQTKTARQYQALRAIGVTAARVQADRAHETPASARQKVSPIMQAGLRPYVENIATDFYSAYHRWSPGKPVNAPFLALQRAIAENPADKSVFIRRPGLSDSGAFDRIKKRLTAIVRIYAPYRPLYFDLADETGVADLSAAWDFDFSASSLSGMRLWLKEQYGTLAALNYEWGTQFARWRDVVPPTTTQTMMRTDENYAAWSDFKSWMDVAFARAVEAGAEAIYAGAPWARAAIEGAQIPGWGGYDYTHLAPTVDVMELYDAGESLDLAQEFNPRLVTLTTINWSQPGALHRAWREFLRGVRGVVLWDADDRLVNPEGNLGPDGRIAAGFLAEMQKGPANLILSSRPVRVPIAVVYSPQSYRLQWLLDHRALGASWTRLSSEDANADNAVRAARRRVLRLLGRLGVSPHFVSEKEITTRRLRHGSFKIVILPQTLALSGKAADEIRAFVSAGGTLVSEGQTGLFDGHGRRLAQPRFSAMFDGTNPRAISLSSDDDTAIVQLEQILMSHKIVSEVRIAASAVDGSLGVERYLYRNGALTILALLADPAAEKGQKAVSMQISLPRPAYVYNVQAKRFLAHAKQFSVSTETSMPTVLAISSTPLSAESCRSLMRWQACP